MFVALELRKLASSMGSVVSSCSENVTFEIVGAFSCKVNAMLKL
jgi:hypothetical protein